MGKNLLSSGKQILIMIMNNFNYDNNFVQTSVFWPDFFQLLTVAFLTANLVTLSPLSKSLAPFYLPFSEHEFMFTHH